MCGCACGSACVSGIHKHELMCARIYVTAAQVNVRIAELLRQLIPRRELELLVPVADDRYASAIISYKVSYSVPSCLMLCVILHNYKIINCAVVCCVQIQEIWPVISCMLRALGPLADFSVSGWCCTHRHIKIVPSSLKTTLRHGACFITTCMYCTHGPYKFDLYIDIFLYQTACNNALDL